MKHLQGIKRATLGCGGITLDGSVELTADIAGPQDSGQTTVSGRFYAAALPAINGVVGCRLSVGSLLPVWVEAGLPVNAVPGLMGALDLSFPPGVANEAWLDKFFG